MRRISIRGLMTIIVVSAVGLAALRNANDLWAAMIFLVAAAAVGVAVLGALFSRGGKRAWWTGFALFGGGYLVAALGPLQPQLITTHLLELIHRNVTTVTVVEFEVSRADQNSILYRVVYSDGVTVRKVANNVVDTTPPEVLLASMAPAKGWRSAIPGAANHDPFLRVGHGLFAFLAGLVGGTVAAWFWRRQERAEAAWVPRRFPPFYP
jgi:hypothetical protein